MLKPASLEWRRFPGSGPLRRRAPKVAGCSGEGAGRERSRNGRGPDAGQGRRERPLALVKVADEIRRRVVGDRITYVVNRNLNFTNVCIVGCAFCGFSRGPDSPDAYFHSTDTLVAKSVEAVELGATEVCIQGGLPKDLDGYYYVQLLRAIKARLPELHVHAYSPMEITYGVEKTRLPLREYLLMLKEAGLNSIPGTAAEILDDRCPQIFESQQAESAAVDRRHSHGA
jgi:2-iminoacetate synthase ThiH